MNFFLQAFVWLYAWQRSRSLAVAEATSRNNNKLFFPGEYFENFNFLQKEKKRLSHFLFCKAFKAKKLKSD